MNTMNTEHELFKIEEDGTICFDPTCDDNTPTEIDHSKDRFNVEEKEVFFENGLIIKIKNGVNYLYGDNIKEE